MSGYEYKTLSLPRMLKGPRARRQSAADFVSGVVESALNDEQARGWEFMGAQEFATLNRSGLFGRVEPTDFIVLIFRRPRETVEALRRRTEPPASGARAPAQEVHDPYDAHEEPRTPPRPSPRAPSRPAPEPQPQTVTPYPPRSPAAAPMFRGGRPAPADPAAAPRAPSTGAPGQGQNQGTPRLDDDFGKI